MPRLLTICIDYLCKHIEEYADQIEVLPSDLKSRLFSVLSKINNLKDTSILVKLITKQLSVIELRFVDLDDEFLNAIDCPNLRYLNMNSRKYNITSNGLIGVFARVPHLKTLILVDCTAMNDAVLQYINCHCPLLKWLDIIGSINVTDTGIGYLSNLKLRALNISNIKQNGDGIKKVVDGASSEHLSELRVSRCGLPAATLQHVLEQCPLLSIFLFDGCEAPVVGKLISQQSQISTVQRLRFLLRAKFLKLKLHRLSRVPLEKSPVETANMDYMMRVSNIHIHGIDRVVQCDWFQAVIS